MTQPLMHLFGINQNKTTDLTLLLFTPCYNFICKQVEELYQETIKQQRKEDKYNGMYIGITYFYRPEDKQTTEVAKSSWIRIDDSLVKKGENLEAFLNKVRKDVRFIQMWLSLIVDPTSPVNTRAKLPNILATQHPLYKTVEFSESIIPPGKEAVWNKAEELIKYYLGLKLLL